MKRSLFGKKFKQIFLAVPAAALMLGASQAQTTVGINFVAQYGADSTYASVGTGYAGYQMTGFPVTTSAFGVAASHWANPAPMFGFYNGTTGPFTSVINAGGITVNANYTNLWSTDLGDLDPYPYYSSQYWETPGSVNPGNDEATWAIEDTGGWANNVSGLAATFPHGYVLELISAAGHTGNKLTTSSQAIITDGATFTNSLGFNIYAAGNPNAPGTVGLAASTILTNDAITISMDVSNKCSLSGFIITDKPVSTWMGLNQTNSLATTNISQLSGTALTLNSGTIGISPLNYQWQLNGTNIPGATFASYTNLSISTNAGGNYQLIITNLYGAATSQVAAVTVLTPSLTTWSGNINGTWDIGATANWLTNGVAATYTDGSLAQFDDTAAITSVNVATPVLPYSVTVTNNLKAYTISGSPIAGAAILNKSGTNGLTLNGANTFSGGINLNAGTLTIGNSGQLGGGLYGGIITNNGSFIWASSAGQTNTGPMNGSGSLILNGSGLLSMGADALVTSGVTINSGTLRVSANNFGTAFSPQVVINTNGTLFGDVVHALGGNSSVFINRGTWLMNYEDYKQNLTMIDGVITNGGGGNGGMLRIGSSGGAGNWTWYVSNSITGSMIYEGVQFVATNTVLTLNVQRGAAASDLTINGTINGNVPGTLIFTGNGITTLNAGNTTGAGMTVSGGTVIVNTAAGSGTTAVTANGTLLIAPNAVLNGSADIGGTFALTPAGGIGQIYIGTSIAMETSGKTVLKIAKDGGNPVADNLYAGILSGGSINYNGTLVVTNVTADSTALAAGDTFTLFSGSSYGGSFSSFVLPPLPAGLSWDYSQLLANGSITVSTAAAPPYFSPAPGNYFTPQVVTINTLTPGATIYYTTDGSTPTSSSAHGTAPVTVNVPANSYNFTISAYAIASGSSASAVTTGIYTIATPTWVNPSGGSWQTTGNWSNNIVANGSGFPADFSKITLSAATTVTLDGSPTVGSINFADVGNTYGWVIAPGTGSGNALRLDNGTNVPVINVQNQIVTITNTPLAGTQGFAKNGAGTLVLGGASSTYTGNTIVNGGTLLLARNSGASGTLTSTNITVNPGATLATSVGDALGYSGSLWVRIINLYGGVFTNTSTANEGWGLTINMMGGAIDFGPNGGIAAGSGTIVNTLATNVTSRISSKFIIRESNPNNQVVFNVASGTASPDLLISGAISQANVSNGGLVKNGAGVMSLTGTNTYGGLTAVSNGTLRVSGVIASTNLVASGLLTGTGKFTGPTTIQSGGTLQPGLGDGDTSTLTISNKLTLAGNVLIAVNRTNAQNSSRIAGISTLTYGGTLTVSNAGTALQQGDTFTLFAATNYVGNFTTTNLPTLSSGLSWTWVPTSGTLSVVATQSVNTNPTNIVTSFSGNTLTLSWPADHTGWRLLAQTNHLELGLSTNTNDWGTVSGSAATNQVIITIDPTKAGGFYRMIYP